MTKAEKEIMQLMLEHEKEIIQLLENNYTLALAEVKERIAILSVQENMQSIIYQKKYQQELEKLLVQILNRLNSNNYQNIEEYLKEVGKDSFLGQVYSLHRQNTPINIMIDEKIIANMINTPVDEIKLSKRLYSNTDKLKKTLKSEISRGFSMGKGYQQMASTVSIQGDIDYRKALRIARTEGARVNNATSFEAMKQAKKLGLDIVKQWDSTLDRKTRPHHHQLDGQIREIEEAFEIAERRAMYPCGFGIASEDIQCRCFALMRLRVAVDEDYTKWDGENDKLVQLKATQNYKDWKKVYLNG